MSRQYLARAVFALAAASVVGGLVAGCGDDDATATSTPTSAGATSEAPADASSKPDPGSGDQPPQVTTSPGAAATAPPETPQSVPSDFPGGSEAPAANAKDEALLDELEKNGVTPSPENATAIAGYICRAIADGSTAEEMNAFVVAFVGSDPDSTQLAPEDAAKVYIEAAKKTYC